MKEEKKILLIHKVLTNEATPKELEQFELFISEEDSKLVEEIKFLWGISGKNESNIKLFDKGGAKQNLFDKIDKEIENVKATNSNKRLLRIRRVLSIAAIFIVIFAVMFVVNSTRDITNADFGKYSLVEPSSLNESDINIIKLEDQTKVWTDQNTKLFVEENFNKKKRIVKLEGNAFFSVTKDAEHPFLINIEDFKIKVIGTSFQIYSDNENIRVEVYSGVVEFSKSNGSKVLLKKGEGATFNPSKLDFQKYIITTNNNMKNNYLVFENSSLKKVFGRLINYYNVKIDIDCDSINSMFGYTSPQYVGGSIKDYFSSIEKLYNVKINKKADKEYIVICE